VLSLSPQRGSGQKLSATYEGAVDLLRSLTRIGYVGNAVEFLEMVAKLLNGCVEDCDVRRKFVQLRQEASYRMLSTIEERESAWPIIASLVFEAFPPQPDIIGVLAAMARGVPSYHQEKMLARVKGVMKLSDWFNPGDYYYMDDINGDAAGTLYNVLCNCFWVCTAIDAYRSWPIVTVGLPNCLKDYPVVQLFHLNWTAASAEDRSEYLDLIGRSRDDMILTLSKVFPIWYVRR
jgi:hypothetical protein